MNLSFAKPAIRIATRGSALALAQANQVLADCRAKFPSLGFELRIIKTSGDKLQTASMSKTDPSLPKGLFTKELEFALLKGAADLAVHSLKDLPTDLPDGLKLAAVAGLRQDVRDVLIYRDSGRLKAQGDAPGAAGRGFQPGMSLKDFPAGLVVATSSTRRRAQLLAHRPDFKVVEIRGNVATRIAKLAQLPELDATILAAAGLARLNFTVTDAGHLNGQDLPHGLLAVFLEPEEMLPCVGQAAIGLEIRAHDQHIAAICAQLNHDHTFQCVLAERAFLRAMGGGCQSPVGAYAEVVGAKLRLRAVSFLGEKVQSAETKGPLTDPEALGAAVAGRLKQADGNMPPGRG